MLLKLLRKTYENFFGLNEKLKSLSKKEYTILSDIELNSPSGEKLHIDYIILSQYGFFILKLLDFKGYISGSEGDEFWKHSNKYNETSFKNPVMEMNEIVLTIRNITNEQFNKIYFMPILVKRNDKFNILSGNIPIIQSSELISYIKGYAYLCNITKEDIKNTIDKLNVASNKHKQGGVLC